jgi:hypothetical protein
VVAEFAAWGEATLKAPGRVSGGFKPPRMVPETVDGGILAA